MGRYTYIWTNVAERNSALHHRVFAVGKTPEEAVNALAWILQDDEAEDIEELEEETPGGWYRAFRMKSCGTSMKAAGLAVPGGVVLTWWK